MLEGLGSPFISELMLPPSKPAEGVTNSAANDPLVSKSRRRPLLGPSPGCFHIKTLLSRDHGMDTQDLEFKFFAKRVETSYVVTATYDLVVA